MLTSRQKQNVIGEHRSHDADTGSTAVQIALLSRQIDELTAHLKKHPKDNHSRRGLLGMVSKRRKLLKYLEDRNPKTYAAVTKKLGLK
ncbi:MAG: 30S ribosomal protein S15 [Patescibacteria group bacterium]|nr:30S ribosomal protein S15 [Patescibacteria group bacterium]MCL5224471.1 30S ribosomal protein S15 [Patescibacteria group bacterium]